MNLELYSSINGVVIAIADVNDPAFSQKILGDGVAVRPEAVKQTIVSPCDGTVVMVSGTGHAVALTAGDFEILIHVGVDTVNLKGEGFTPLVAADKAVKKGDKLIDVDFAAIVSKVPSIDVITVITNLDGAAVEVTKSSTVAAGDHIFTIKK